MSVSCLDVLEPQAVQDVHPSLPQLRVAVVTETYPPEVNGVAATLSRVVEGLHERGHHLQLVRPRQPVEAAEPPERGDRFEQVLARGLPIPCYPDLRAGLPATGRLLELWTQRRPDVVHIVTEGPLGWSALQAAGRLKLPVVSDFRTNFQAYSGHYRLGWLRGAVMGYLRRFHNRTACTMVPTEGLRRELAAQGLRGLRVVARGVDTQLFDPSRRSDALRASWGASPGSMVALCVGRLAPEKNLGAVLAAAQTMRADDDRLQLVFVGDGPERARLMQQCPDAHYAGLRRGADLAMHYASADVFLFPSITETWGNVVAEAMASGLAVVAYDQAAAGELIRHGESGLLASTDDTAEFCRMARRLAGDVPQARALGRQARVVAGGLDWSRIVDAVLAEYHAAIAPDAARSGAALQAVLPQA